MGGFKSAKATGKRRGRQPGKIDASLNEKLNNVKWGEFKIGDLFEIQSYKKRFDANKVDVKSMGRFPYVVRMSDNNGQKGFIDENEIYLNEGNTISFGQDTATMFYQEVPYFTGDKIKILKFKNDKFNKKNAQFFLTAMMKPFALFAWGSSSFGVDIIKKQELLLPITKNGEIDFEFMESFIADIEAERIAELSAYLSVSGLDNYKLTHEEQKALKDFDKTEWKEYNVTDIFDVNNTCNILSRDIVLNSGETPYLCAGADNNSVSSYISYDEKYLSEGNCIFIGGKTFVVSYQEKSFFSNDSHNLALYLKDKTQRNKLNQLYMAVCINKSLRHKYSWGDSISNKKIQGDRVLLPSANGQPDYDIMKTFISAVKKLVIKDVVLYSDNKISAAKKVIQ